MRGAAKLPVSEMKPQRLSAKQALHALFSLPSLIGHTPDSHRNPAARRRIIGSLPLTVASILFGALFTALTAYALGVLALRGKPAPPEIALGLGAVVESALVFLLLCAHLGHRAAFLFIGAAALTSLRWVRLRPLAEPAIESLRPERIAAAVIFGAYGVWYLVNALAPETQSDGITYHLGLPYEYVRLHGFPHRVTFYDLVPQGMEMLYTVAFAFGRHSAAKLVEFGFLLASVPLMFRIGRRLRLSDTASLLAAAVYFCAPIVGLSGSSSYTDAAGVFFALASFYLLLVWRDTEDPWYLLPAGMLAGFCYAVKLSGGFAVLAAVCFALSQRRVRAALRVALGAILVMTPWLVRGVALAHNPVAPLFNGLFPNAYFDLATEARLAADLGTWAGVPVWRLPWELALGYRFAGAFGPFLLVLPIGLIGLRQRSGRWALGAAVILAVPWWFDSGARFLMPAIACAAFAVAMALPRPAAWVALALQAVFCWPQVMNLRDHHPLYRLHEFPLAAALRTVPEAHYLEQHLEDFNVARMLERRTAPGDTTLALMPVAQAYLDRDVRIWWQSAETGRLAEVLRSAAFRAEGSLVAWTAAWPPTTLQAVRFVAPAGKAAEFDVTDVWLYSGKQWIAPSPRWTVHAWPNAKDAPLALDGNLLTRWRSRQPVTGGMHLEIDFDRPVQISRAVLFSHAYRPGILDVFGQCDDRSWRRMGGGPAAPRPPEHLHLEAGLALRAAGYRYILAPTGGGGFAPIGNALVAEAPLWGVQFADHAGRYYLFRVK
jgi:4-amino-4-deoxy-L-arabinose transferase-like glycosyltransferase